MKPSPWIALVLFSFYALVACKDPPQGSSDAGNAAPDATPVRVKKVDLDKCDAGVQEQERIARAAKKACATSADCAEWIRSGNCGSIPLAKPFPPAGSEAHWQELTQSVDLTCPDEPKCKWASMGVECRAGICAPSLEGRMEFDGGR